MYKHTQIGWLMIVVAAIMLVFLPVTVIQGHGSTRGSGMGIVLGIAAIIILLFFSTLTVQLDNEAIAFSFGVVRLIRRTLLLKDVVSHKTVRGKWWCWSWGIHGWPRKGWLYNVSGLAAVEFVMRNGMKYYIGTDEPDKLCEAIQQATRENASSIA
jgi:hypothetical protein